MARFLRASLLLIALGAAAPALPASAAAANAGGAAPGSEAVAPGAPAAGASAGSNSGGAAPGVTPPRSANSSARSGGALAGKKPAQRLVRRPAPRRAAPPSTPGATPVEPLPTAPATVDGTFPVQGVYTFGGREARFGADRPGHRHQGQDMAAASGTPLVAPVAGTITWKANQPGGAGIYLVLRDASGERDYVFMHIKRGTVLVSPGATVAAGQQLAQVGSTGSSSGPHLHFEIWLGGWGTRSGMPIDPLPQLQRWAGVL